MKRYKKCYELKNEAKDKLDGKYYLCIMVCLTNVVIQYIVTLFLSAFLPSLNGVSVPVYIMHGIASLLITWVLGVMRLGLDFFFLKAACGQTYRISDLFYGYRNDFSKTLSLSGVYALLTAVCELPFQYLAVTYFLTGNESLIIPAIIAGIVGLCIYLPVSAGLFLSFYLMLDFPDKSAKEIVSLSFRLMKGSKRRVLYMTFSFIPLILLCVCSFYIGFLWLMPYMKMTGVCFFLDIMNPKETA